jgi:hypothetical protein
MNYDTYLFSCLLKEYNEGFRELPYDEQYDLINGFYEEFEDSPFNDVNKGLYECLVNYFNDKYDEQ